MAVENQEKEEYESIGLKNYYNAVSGILLCLLLVGSPKKLAKKVKKKWNENNSSKYSKNNCSSSNFFNHSFGTNIDGSNSNKCSVENIRKLSDIRNGKEYDVDPININIISSQNFDYKNYDNDDKCSNNSYNYNINENDDNGNNNNRDDIEDTSNEDINNNNDVVDKSNYN